MKMQCNFLFAPKQNVNIKVLYKCHSDEYINIIIALNVRIVAPTQTPGFSTTDQRVGLGIKSIVTLKTVMFIEHKCVSYLNFI